ncbi:hypothetical protein BDV96DRAFT_565435 [Lophiotrema nucula]|uniref:Uncharacterized protein n=1 Tax=Lophiotrema nucula TaxID=690887 RepID=A0A6A5ZMB4_9PLEO|nr:hypothetical protein BDV96DRAFT_565435 [Lophiotrema nucula]
MFSFFTQLVRPASGQEADAPLSQPADLDSLPDFAQAVVEKLQTETVQLTSGPGVALFKGVFCSFLDTVPEYLYGLTPSQRSDRYQPSQERVLVLLDYLENLCEVSPCHLPTPSTCPSPTALLLNLWGVAFISRRDLVGEGWAPSIPLVELVVILTLDVSTHVNDTNYGICPQTLKCRINSSNNTTPANERGFLQPPFMGTLLERGRYQEVYERVY